VDAPREFTSLSVMLLVVHAYFAKSQITYFKFLENKHLVQVPRRLLQFIRP
jgi:hypothetical protein